MKYLSRFIILAAIALLSFSSCELLGEFDIRGDWDATVIDNTLGQIVSTIATFTGSKESGIVTDTLPPSDPYYQTNPSRYTVQANHVIVTRPGLPSAICPTCGNRFDGNFAGANNVTGTWFDYREPPHSGTWTMKRR